MWLVGADDVHLPDQHGAPDRHGDGDDGQVDAREVEAANVDVLLGEYVAPQQAGERRADGGAEGAVVDAERHAVDGRPEGAVADAAAAVGGVQRLPRQDDARQ